MARAPEPAVKVGDLISTENKLCCVNRIEDTFGFNTYVLVELETGTVLRKHRHELQTLDFLLDECVFEPNVGATEEKQNEEIEKKRSKRFVSVTEQELDDFALNRNSKRTRKQTDWAVSIFKGETLEKCKQMAAILNF